MKWKNEMFGVTDGVAVSVWDDETQAWKLLSKDTSITFNAEYLDSPYFYSQPNLKIDKDIVQAQLSGYLDSVTTPMSELKQEQIVTNVTNSMKSMSQAFHTASEAMSQWLPTVTAHGLVNNKEEAAGLKWLFPGMMNEVYLGECPVEGCRGSDYNWRDVAGNMLGCLCQPCADQVKNLPLDQLDMWAVRKRFSLMSWVVHLNDGHLWPRAEKDRNEGNKDKPTIYDWLKDGVEKYGWDLTAAVPEEE